MNCLIFVIAVALAAAVEAKEVGLRSRGMGECEPYKSKCPAVDGKDPVYLPLPDCTKFCECSNGVPYIFDCPAGLHFNTELNVCDWPQNAGCEGSGGGDGGDHSGGDGSGEGDGGRGQGECAKIPNTCPAVDGKDPVYLPLPDCTKFCECSNGVPYEFDCPAGLHFNTKLNVCDWPQNAGCDGNGEDEGSDEDSDGGDDGAHGGGDDSDEGDDGRGQGECANIPNTCPAVDGKDPVYLPLPDCTKFCECSNGVPYEFDCPAGLHFNTKLNVCDWPQNAGCDGNGGDEGSDEDSEGGDDGAHSGGDDSGEGDDGRGQGECANIPNTCPAVDGKDPVYLPLPDCTKFCECSNGVPYEFDCPAGLHFNTKLNVCDWPQNAGCDGNGGDEGSDEDSEGGDDGAHSGGDDSGEGDDGRGQGECANIPNTCPAVDGKDPVYLPLPDCTKFCECSNGVPYEFDCPAGLHFNTKLNVCDWPQNAGCDGNGGDEGSDEDSEGGDDGAHSGGDDSGEGDDGRGQGECANIPNTCPAVDGKDPVYLPLPDCTKFCECSNGVPYEFDCPAGLHFNTKLNVCDWPQNAGCDGNGGDDGSDEDSEGGDDGAHSGGDDSGEGDDGRGQGECANIPNTCPAVDGKDPVYLPLPDCTKFCECSNGVPYEFDCPAGLHFNTKLNVCDWPQNAGCDGNGGDEDSDEDSNGGDDGAHSGGDDSGEGDDGRGQGECANIPNTCPAVDGKDPVYLPLPDCTKFCECSNGVPYEFDCPAGLHFNTKLNVCDWPQNAGCDGNGGDEGSDEDSDGGDDGAHSGGDDSGEGDDGRGQGECANIPNTCPAVDGKDPVYLPLPDCTKFCECSNGVPYEFDCPAGLHFNTKLNVCDWPQNAGCDGNGGDEGSDEDSEGGDDGAHSGGDDSGEGDDGRGQGECANIPNTCPAVDGKYPVYLPLPDCTKFCECSNGVPYEFDCPAGLHFNTKLNVCDWPQNAGCDGNDGDEGSNEDGDGGDDGSHSGGDESGEGDDGRGQGECANIPNTCPAVDGKDPVYLPLPDCTKFCECSNGVPYEFDCPAGLHFNTKLNVCDWPQNAGCDGNGGDEGSEEDSDGGDDGAHSGGDDSGEGDDGRGQGECANIPNTCPAVDGKDPVYLPLPDCTKFCECSNGVPYEFDCPAGLQFNTKLNVCDWPQNAGCDGNGGDEGSDEDSDGGDDGAHSGGDDSGEGDDGRGQGECANIPNTCPAVDGKDPVYLPLPDCTKFCECSNGVPYEFDCPAGLHFNTKLNVCDWPQNAGCDGNGGDEGSDEDSDGGDDGAHSGGDDSGEGDDGRGQGECANIPNTCPAVDGKDPVYLPLPDCTKFCECSNGVPYEFDCPAGLHFNTKLNVCDWPQNAGCDGNGGDEGSDEDSEGGDDGAHSGGDDSGEGDDGRGQGECANIPNTCPAVDGKDPVYLPLPDCTKFCECSNGVPYEFDCPAGLHFNTKLNVCDWPQNAGCDGNGGDEGSDEDSDGGDDGAHSGGDDSGEGDDGRGQGECANIPNTCPAVDGKDPVYLPLPDCTKFCECSNGVPYEFDCPAGLHFNTKLNVCDWPQNAGCDGNGGDEGSDEDSDGGDDGAHSGGDDSGEGDDGRGQGECANIPNTCPAVDGKDPVYLPLPDCTKFCECSNGVPYEFDCPAGLHFNTKLNVCDWPQNAGCDGNGGDEGSDEDSDGGDDGAHSGGDDSGEGDDGRGQGECANIPNTCPAVDGKDPVYLPLPDCTKFCECSNGVPYEFDCPAGLHFNTKLNVCDWPQNAGCDGNGGDDENDGEDGNGDDDNNGGNDNDGNDDNGQGDCATIDNTCPAVDGPDSVYIPLPDCTKFCQCSNGVPYEHNCPEGLHFNKELNVCDWPQDAGCNGNGGDDGNGGEDGNGDDNNNGGDDNDGKDDNGQGDCANIDNTCPAVDGPDSVYIPLPDCTKFCQCSNGVPYEHNCPEGLHFNKELNVCDWPQNAGCNENGGDDGNGGEDGNGDDNNNGGDDNDGKDDNGQGDCANIDNTCPAVDGPDSVYIPLPDCTKFCQCSNGVPYEHNCPEGLHFNKELNVCDWPQNAGCNGNGGDDGNGGEDGNGDDNNNGGDDNDGKDDNGQGDCANIDNTCPAVDGPDSVYIPLPDCTKFCQCSNGVPYEHNCPEGLHFNKELNVCDWPQNAGCNGNGGDHGNDGEDGNGDDDNNGGNDNDGNDDNGQGDCANIDNTCPAVDGPDSVYIPLPDCTKFCQCSNGVPYEHNCPEGLHFNKELNVCDWPQNAGCNGNGGDDENGGEDGNGDDNNNGGDDNDGKDDNGQGDCANIDNTCPAVDGPDSVYLPLPDCTKFCQCSNGTPYEFTCPSGLHFNPEINVCDWPQNVNSCKNP